MRANGLYTLAAAQATDTWPDIRVACVWLPQLSLRVEVLVHPAWDGRPLVLGGGPGERKVVQLCSPEAEQAGIRPGLPLREVLSLCRDAIVLQPDPVRTAAVRDRVLAALQSVSPAVEASEEHLFLDLRGLRDLYERRLTALEQAIRAVVPPLLCPRLGFAAGKFAAAVAARLAPTSEGAACDATATLLGLRAGEQRVLRATALVVPAARTAAFLAPLPIAYLPFTPDTLRRLDLLGLRTIGDLARLPAAAVQAELGPEGARAWRLASGHDDEPVVPRPVSLSVSASMRFDDPLASVEAIQAALGQVVGETFAHPALRGRSARQARLRALLADGTSWERLYTFKEALASREAARLALKGKLELPNGLPPAPVEELALELLGLGGEAAKQGSLFTVHARQRSQITEASRHLRARYGGHAPLYHAVEVEPWSRVPERRWALVPCDL